MASRSYAPGTARVALGVCLALVLALVTRVAHADEPANADDSARERAPAQGTPKAALEHYAQGREHFRAGRYREAIVELKAALALDPTSANLLYNVAYTSELLGNLEEAIDFYRKYMAALPPSEAAERTKTELTLRRLEGRLAEQPAQEASPPSGGSTPSAGIGRADVWFWASLGTGAALLAGGTVMGVLALTGQRNVKDFVIGHDGSFAKRNELKDRANTFALSSDVMFGTGAALLVTSALLFLLREPDSDALNTDRALRATCSSDGRSARLLLAGSF